MSAQNTVMTIEQIEAMREENARLKQNLVNCHEAVSEFAQEEIGVTILASKISHATKYAVESKRRESNYQPNLQTQ